MPQKDISSQNLFSQTLSQNRWETILAKAYSNSIYERGEAITNLIQRNNRNSLVVLRNRLSTERNRVLRAQLILFFEKRSSETDFYHLMLFLRASHDNDNARKCMSLLHRINSKRLRFELFRLFKDKNQHIYSLVFIESIFSPLAADIQWFKKIFYKYRIAKSWLSLDSKFDRAIVQALKPYYNNALFTKRLTNYTLYWLIQYSHYHNIQLRKQLFQYISLPIVESFSEIRQEKFLESAAGQLFSQIQIEEWFQSSSEKITLWVLKMFLKSSRHISRPKKDLFATLLFQKLRNQKKPFFFRAILSFHKFKNIVFENSWSKDIQNIMNQKCKSLPQLQFVCFTYFLQVDQQKAYEMWNVFSSSSKKIATLENMSMIVRCEIFVEHGFYQWALFNKEFEIRYRFVFLSDTSMIEENITLFTKYLQHEKKIPIKTILIDKIITNHKLIKLIKTNYTTNE